MTSVLRVATCQLELRPETGIDGFLAHLRAVVAEAARQGAELVVLPELAGTGLLATVTDHEVTTATIAADFWQVLPGFTDRIVAGLVEIAAEHDLTVLGGSHVRLAADGTLRNTAYLVRPDGRVETQDKLHLTPPELELGARGGDSLLVTTVGPFTVGVLVCADIQFPELSRWLVGRGVDLVLCPSLTWNRRGVNRVRIGAQARAMENQWYVVVSTLVGSDGLPADRPAHTVGEALVTGPIDRNSGANDGILARTEAPGEQVLVVDLDRDLLLRSRERPESPGLALRRLDLYPDLQADAGPG
jgi:predicted amidohydrolase